MIYISWDREDDVWRELLEICFSAMILVQASPHIDPLKAKSPRDRVA